MLRCGEDVKQSRADTSLLIVQYARSTYISIRYEESAKQLLDTSQIVPWKSQNFHGGMRKFFGLIISFFRSIVWFFRRNFPCLRGEFSFSSELLEISSVGTGTFRRGTFFEPSSIWWAHEPRDPITASPISSIFCLKPLYKQINNKGKQDLALLPLCHFEVTDLCAWLYKRSLPMSWR